MSRFDIINGNRVVKSNYPIETIESLLGHCREYVNGKDKDIVLCEVSNKKIPNSHNLKILVV